VLRAVQSQIGSQLPLRIVPPPDLFPPERAWLSVPEHVGAGATAAAVADTWEALLAAEV
jgi:hypothetical protein